MNPRTVYVPCSARRLNHGGKLQLPSRTSAARKRYFEETDKEVVMLIRQNFKSETLCSILDSLMTELMKRKEVYCKLPNKFGFLFHITILSEFELREAASNLQQHLSTDVEHAFVEVFIQFSEYTKQVPPETCSRVGLLSVGLLVNHEFVFLLREAKRFGVSLLFLCNYYFNYFAFWNFI